jgi:hypothetical protein
LKPVRLAVVHLLPVERYPPVQNLLERLSRRADVQVLVISSHQPGRQVQSVAATTSPPEKILRMHCHGRWAVTRWCKIIIWHCRTAWLLHRFRPDVVLSVEPHSALAAWLHRHLFRSRARLVIQHYEYYSEEDYRRRGNRLLRLNRLFERSLLKQADRVTQTNPDRLRLFAADHPYVRPEQLTLWPNYPPKSWFGRPDRKWPVNPTGPLRLVVAGAVSLRDTYIGPLVAWITSDHQSACTLDIYSSSCDAQTATWLQASSCDRLRFHLGGVPYSELPEVLRTFDVGLILYRGHTANFVWNATNKLFEYLTCGLDVWYPPCMLGVAPHARSTAAPRVLETDFNNMETLDLRTRTTRSHLPTVPWTTSCEDAMKPLLDLLTIAESQ